MRESASQFVDAIYDGRLDVVRDLLTSDPKFADRRLGGDTLLELAVMAQAFEIGKFLVEFGCDVNPTHSSGNGTLPLTNAIYRNNVEMVRYLLEQGARTDVDEPVISAITGNKDSLELVKLLEQYGADIHRVFPFGMEYDPVNALSTAMMWGKDDVVEYLRSRGAKLPEELPKWVIDDYFGPEDTSFREKCLANRRRWYVRLRKWFVSLFQRNHAVAKQVIEYFRDHFGTVHPLSIIEIVPTEPSITVHCIPATPERSCVTLFTTGMSAAAMTVPPDAPDSRQYRYAELFMQLPKDWKFTQYEDFQYGWPVHWLRRLGAYPTQNETWLGGATMILDCGMPLGPDLKFDSFLIMAERSFVTRSDRTIQLYRLTPLYPEERELEAREGLPALMRALDAHATPFVVDLKRKNVAVD